MFLTSLRIDDLFLDPSTPEKAFRVETYRSAAVSAAVNANQLRCYFISRCSFPTDLTKINGPNGKVDIRAVSDKAFLDKASENTLDLYQSVMWNVLDRHGPVIELFEVEGTREHRVVIGYKMGTTQHFFSAISDLYHFYSLYSARKYVEQFANGVTIICESIHSVLVLGGS